MGVHVEHDGYLRTTIATSIINSPYLIQDSVLSYSREMTPHAGSEMELWILVEIICSKSKLFSQI